jgi:hypothetical protein
VSAATSPEGARPAEAGGAVAIWVSAPDATRSEFERWHNVEHTSDRVRLPGYWVGRRWRALPAEVAGDLVAPTNYLAFYEVDTAEVLQQPAYLQQLNEPTEWSRRMLAPTFDVERAIYDLVMSHGEEPGLDAPYLLAVRLNAPEGPDGEAELLDWYREEHLPQLGALAGTVRGRVFRRVDAISDIPTTEKEIQRTRVTGQRFLALYEIEHPAAPTSEAWRDASAGTPRSAAFRERLRDVTRELYWLQFVRHAPWRLARRPD